MRERPDPEAAHSSAELVALMRQLRLWADLSYRQLERNAGDAGQVLPRATVSGALNRDELPRESLLAVYVRACGCDGETVSAWLAVRRRLAISSETTEPSASSETTEPSADTVPAVPDAAPPQSGSADRIPAEAASAGNEENGLSPAAPELTPAPRRRYRPAIVTGACAAAGVLALAFWPTGGSSGSLLDSPPRTAPSTGAPSTGAPSTGGPAPSAAPKETGSAPPVLTSAPPDTDSSPPSMPSPAKTEPATLPSTVGAPQMPAEGPKLIHPVTAPRLCLTEGRERNGHTDRPIAVQRPCAEAPLPLVYLVSTGTSASDGLYSIQWHDSQEGIGCLDVDEAQTSPGALVSPRECGNTKNQEFRLEPSHGGFRLSPVHSGLCIGYLPPVTDGAEAVQSTCTGAADQAFRFTAA